MEKVIISLLVGFVIGFAVSWFLSIRRRARRAMEDEFERISRLNMRHIFAEVLPPFSPIISSLSPSFCKIYTQANDAEVYKLDQVAGIAYGRSLEFLIKDFAKFERPDRAAEIETCALANCLKQYVTDESVRNSGQLAVWLRNDETHYVRKYAGKDVQDLKKLIGSTVKLIENAVQRKTIDAETQQIRESMVQGKTGV